MLLRSMEESMIVFKRLLPFIITLAVIMQSGSINALAHPWPMFQHDNAHRGGALSAGPDSMGPAAFKADIGDITEGAPVVASDGTIYVGNHSGKLLAFDPAGALKWAYPTLGVIRGAPLIAPDGTVYVGSKDGGLYAVNPDGTLKWVYFTKNVISSSPTLSNDNATIYVGTYRKGVFAVGIDGVLKWRAPLDMIISAPSPTVAPDGTIYIGGYGAVHGGVMFALNVDGSVKWRITTPGPIRSTVSLALGGTLYFGSRDGRFYALNPDSTVRWTFDAGDEIRASSAVDPIGGTIYFGSYDKNLYALNPDGTLKWSFATNGYIEASPIVDSRGIVYVKPHSGSLYAINSDGTLRSSFNYGYLSSGMALGAGGELYFCGDFKLIAVGPVQPPPPPNPRDPVVELFTGKDAYLPGDTLNINARLTNSTSLTRVVELKVYMRDSQQNLISIINMAGFILKPGARLDKLIYTHTFTTNEASTIFHIGARIMVPETGDTVSIDSKTVSFQGL